MNTEMKEKMKEAVSGKKKKVLSVLNVILFALIAYLPLTAAVWAQGTSAGTSITNGGDAPTVQSADQDGDAFVTWSGGGYAASNSTTVVVSTGFGLSALNSPGDQSLGVGTSIYFGYNFRNIGNAVDTFAISTTALAGWATNFIVTILRDDNQNGAYNAGEDTVIASTALAAETSGYFLVRVFALNGTPDGSSVTIRTRVKDQNGAGSQDNWPTFASGDDDRIDDVTATVSAAILTLTKGIALSTDTRPGGFVTYVATISNTGSGAATSVVYKDRIPANASYVSASISTATVGGSDVPQTDAGSDDAADYNVTESGVITVNFPSIAPGSKAIVKFKIRIK